MQKTKIINQDNKKYEFTPGEGGRLVVKGEKKPILQGLKQERPPMAKVIMPATYHGYAMSGKPEQVQ